MFEGFIASKFANKLFEKDIYRIVRNHALFGALIMMFPDLGLGTLVFIGVLWHMYSSICNKVGISFSDHFWSLVGIGFFVNIVIALVIDVIFSFLFFLEGFIIYFQFYMSGKLFVESIKKLDFDDDNGDGLQRKLPQVEHPQRIAPISQEPVKRPNTMVYEPTKKKQEITIGRSNSCDIRFSQNDDYASNFHGRIFMNGNQLMYRDTSSNGTVINGKMVHHIAIPINRGDRIMIAGKYPITWSQIDGFLNNSFQ